MKLLVIMLLATGLLQGEERHQNKQVQDVGNAFDIELGPLLPLSPTIPIEISEENREKLFERSAAEAASHNTKIFQEKSFPWLELLSCGLVGLLLWLARRETKQMEWKESPQKRLERVRQQALKTIGDLKQKPAKENFGAIYFVLTEAVRQFLEEKYQVPASTRTTPEFLQEMAINPGFSNEERQRFTKFLVSADKVKFALHQPTDSEWKESLHTAEEVVASGSK